MEEFNITVDDKNIKIVRGEEHFIIPFSYYYKKNERLVIGMLGPFDTEDEAKKEFTKYNDNLIEYEKMDIETFNKEILSNHCIYAIIV